PSACFNGSTARVPWDRYWSRSSTYTRRSLQWVHGTRAVGSAGKHRAFSSLVYLLQWVHGTRAVGSHHAGRFFAVAIWSFNGSTARVPWDRRQTVQGETRT